MSRGSLILDFIQFIILLGPVYFFFLKVANYNNKKSEMDCKECAQVWICYWRRFILFGGYSC